MTLYGREEKNGTVRKGEEKNDTVRKGREKLHCTEGKRKMTLYGREEKNDTARKGNIKMKLNEQETQKSERPNFCQ